jgi:ribosomal protein S18 acetylase RimI-like enzyme
VIYPQAKKGAGIKRTREHPRLSNSAEPGKGKFIMDTVYEEINLDSLSMPFFKSFDRHQEVKRCLRKENGEWVLKDVAFIEEWDENELEKLLEELRHTVSSGGKAAGAFRNGRVIGFLSVENEFFGSKRQYLQLSNLHVSYESRGQGVGKKLFENACRTARDLGAKKLYISAHSAEETQAFYRSAGCLDAEEINERLARAEPFDCQLEYCLEL